ncbi:hypothetical protein N7517_002962 [Penicillium concentricum]|uniref:Uncharacterized protein n=1 Tax=Penicillium concentricum TaxID=293559 RepID=A0A9W9SUN3_9EURO|nr:uncharacterized protein N7517_002962 [Penicillium concentricum]KAJ5385051.1 hypothetical protein N7517_002962 [Penicillium concentricum]
MLSQSDFSHLDAAATALTDIFYMENIHHIFIGGYATGLLGGGRVTEDIDLVVDKNCRSLLLQYPDITESEDNRLVYRHCGTKVHIDMEVVGNAPWTPNPRSTKVYNVAPTDCPERRLRSTMPILHPSILLLTKLLPWKEADQATRVARHMRARTDLLDIHTILQWLFDKDSTIDFSGFPAMPRGRLMCLIGRLYRVEKRTRPYLALTMSPEEMRDVLTAWLHIDVMSPHTRSWHIPDPRTTDIYNVNPRIPEDRPELRLNTSILIVYPSVLVLTKLKCWSTAEMVTRQAYHQRTHTDLADIMTIIRWLAEHRMNINFAGLSRVPKGDLLSLRAKLYWTQKEMRPHLAAKLTPEELREVLNTRLSDNEVRALWDSHFH